jgi:hypothetical protein
MSFDLFEHKERDQETETPSEVTEQEQREVDLNDSLFRRYLQSQGNWAEESAKLHAFFYNAQFTPEQVEILKERGQAAIPLNVIYPAVEQAVAMMTTNRPSFQATGREDSDRRTASAVTDVLSYIWEHSEASNALKQALFDAYVMGRGALFVYPDFEADFGRGELCIKTLNPLEVFPDPASKDPLWRDAAHVLIVRDLTREQIEALWPKARGILVGSQGIREDQTVRSTLFSSSGQYQPVVDDPEAQFYRVIERMTRVKVPYVHTLDTVTGIEEVHLKDELQAFLERPAFLVQEAVLNPMQPEEQPPMQSQYLTGTSDVEQAMAMYQEAQPVDESGIRVVEEPVEMEGPEGEPIEAMRLTYLIPLTYAQLIEEDVIVVRDVLLDRIMQVTTIGNRLYWRGYLPVEHYPVVPVQFRHKRDPYPMSDIGFVKPLQESLNKIHMQVLANISTGNNNKIIIPRGAVKKEDLERELAKAGTAVIEVDYELGEPKIIGPSPLPAGLFAYMDQLTGMIERELGIFSMQQGDASAAPQTFRGTLVLDEFGQRRIRSKVDDVEMTLRQLARIIVQYLPQVYDRQKIIRLVQPNGIVKETSLNTPIYDDRGELAERINDITVGQYDVVVVAGSTLPSNRWALNEYYERLYQMQAIDDVELLKKSELIDVEGVLERKGMMQQMQQYIQQLEEELKGLRGDLQTAEREEIHAKKRLEVEKFKGDLKAASTQAVAATELHRARMANDAQLMRRGNELDMRELRIESKRNKR